MKNITARHVALLQQHPGIVHAALRRCHLYPEHPDYDDFLQLGQITFLTTLAAYEKPYERLADWHTFVGYVSQKIYWRLLDELKRQHERKYATLQLNADVLAHYKDDAGENFVATLEINNHIRLFQKELTPLESELLTDLLSNGLTISEYAKKHHIARSTAYIRRNQLAKKYRRFRDKHKPKK